MSDFKRKIKDRWWRIVLVLLPFLFGLGFYITEQNVTDKTAADLHVWLQFLTTNWPNWTDIFDRHSLWFSLAVSIRFALAYTLISGVIGAFVGLLAWSREKIMNYAEALKFRDRAIELEMLNLLSSEQRDEQTRARVHGAIEKASRDWEREYLPNLVGPTLAQDFIRRLHEEQLQR